MQPLVDIVIACHDHSRPLRRAVESVLADEASRRAVRVTVVAHGVDAAPFEQALAGVAGEWRVLPFADGIRSAAGPFNFGLDRVDTEYCAVMGSDDFLEPGTMAAWLAHIERRSPDALIAKIRIQGQQVMPNPLVRWRRSENLDAAKDRLFYRTAPLGLLKTAHLRALGLRMEEGVRTGEDFEFGIRLWTESRRLDFAAGAGCYVIGTDAQSRTTTAVMSIAERFEAITRLLDSGRLEGQRASHRIALAIKLVRVSVIGAAHLGATAEDWNGDAEVAELGAILRRLIVSPAVLRPFNLADRAVLDVLLDDPRVEPLLEATRAARKAGRRQRWLTRNPFFIFGRESSLRRYVLYFLGRGAG